MNGAEILLQPERIPRLLQGLWVTVWIAGVSVERVHPSRPVGGLVDDAEESRDPGCDAHHRLRLHPRMPQLALLFLAYYGLLDGSIGISMPPVPVCWCSSCGRRRAGRSELVAHCSRFPKCSTNRATYWG